MTRTPYTVTAPEGQVKLVIMNATDGLPAAFALMGTRAERKVALRLAGGCKGMDADDKASMIAFFEEAFAGFRGLVWSGGTRAVKDGEIDIMVTDVPGVIAAGNPGSVALGTTPRTDMLRLQGESRLVIDEWGQMLNPDMSGILVVQNGPDGDMDWDGDLDAYFKLMENWQKFGAFKALGLIAWNGGGVTRTEIIRAAKKKWPVILVKGSGRATDKIIDGLEAEDTALIEELGTDAQIYIVTDPGEMRNVLMDTGFLSE